MLVNCYVHGGSRLCDSWNAIITVPVLGCFSTATWADEGGDGRWGDVYVRSMMGFQKGNAGGHEY